jgi:hypothetical protein
MSPSKNEDNSRMWYYWGIHLCGKAARESCVQAAIQVLVRIAKKVSGHSNYPVGQEAYTNYDDSMCSSAGVYGGEQDQD